jgi:hypothetical protein
MWTQAAAPGDADAAGFTDVTELDRTVEFAAVTRAWIEQWELHRDELAALLGIGVVDERQAERRAQLAAIEDGGPAALAVHRSAPIARAAPLASRRTGRQLRAETHQTAASRRTPSSAT